MTVVPAVPTRTMGDATHDNVPALEHAGVQLVAGYVTGTPSIRWTVADWALFPNVPHVTIDQGWQSPPETTATVRDVEPGAWTMAAATGSAHPWTAVRKTIYCSVSALPALEAFGWQGDIWVAWYNGNPHLDFAVPAGMTCVAKQYSDQGGGGAYDLSTVFDPAWPALTPDPPAPKGHTMPVIVWGQKTVYLLSGGRAHVIQSDADLQTYLAAGLTQIGSKGGRLLTTTEEAAFVADFQPGNPPVSIPPVTATFPPMTLTGTITPA